MNAGRADLAGKVALVLGGGAGIGLAVATRLAERGARVVIAGRSEEGARAAEKLGRDAVFLRCDLNDPATVTAAFAAIDERCGGLDLAVNCAGADQPAIPIDETDLAEFDRVMAINVRGVWLALSQEIGAMRRRGGGAIVNIASIAGLRGYPGLSAYCAAKHAVIGMTRAASLDGAPHRIRVNCTCPGTTATAMMTRQMATRPGGLDSTIARIPLGRVSRPDEQAAAILWLLSDEASFVTGEAMAVDGGRTVG